MGDFFKPWRRKIGVVTLVLACLFMAGWVRSHFYVDLVRIESHQLRSVGSMLMWVKFGDWNEFNNFSSKADFWETDNAKDVGWLYLRLNGADDWKFCGFKFGNGFGHNGLRFLHYWVVPYYAVVLPLTLLSAYLLLSKPRVAKPKTIVEVPRL